MVEKRVYGEQVPYNGTPCIRGHESPRYLKGGGCIKCQRDKNAKSCIEDKEKRSSYLKQWTKYNREYCNKRRVEYSKNHPIKTMLNAARRASKNKNIPYDLSEKDIKIPERCPVLDIELARGFGERSSASPSLDRIVPELGYVKGNVMVISWRANRIKSDATIEELQRVANFYASHSYC